MGRIRRHNRKISFDGTGRFLHGFGSPVGGPPDSLYPKCRGFIFRGPFPKAFLRVFFQNAKGTFPISLVRTASIVTRRSGVSRSSRISRSSAVSVFRSFPFSSPFARTRSLLRVRYRTPLPAAIPFLSRSPFAFDAFDGRLVRFALPTIPAPFALQEEGSKRQHVTRISIALNGGA